MLREAIVAARDAMNADERARASRAIAERIGALDAYSHARAVLAFLPYRSEWDATLVVRDALAAGKIVAAPRVDPAARMLRPLRIASLERDVEAGYRGIPEPRASCVEVPPERFDLVIVPGVAFDATGGRLGYGGGFYDRTLDKLRTGGAADPLAVGVAFSAQHVARVPRDEFDQPLDWIVTEKAAHHFASVPAEVIATMYQVC